MFSLDCCWAPLDCSLGPEECTVYRAGSRSSSGSRTSSYSSLASGTSRSSDTAGSASSWSGQRGAAATCAAACYHDRSSSGRSGTNTEEQSAASAFSGHSDDAPISEDSGSSMDRGLGDRSSDRGRSLFVAFAHQEDAMAVAAAVVSGDSLRWASPTSILGFGGGFSDSYRALRRLSDHMDVDRMSYEELLELGDRIGYVRRRAPSAEELDSLPKRRLTYTDCIGASIGKKGFLDKECSVCREAYAPNDEVRTLPCLHVFHAQCIDRWLTGGMPGARLCPVCNAEVPF